MTAANRRNLVKIMSRINFCSRLVVYNQYNNDQRCPCQNIDNIIAVITVSVVSLTLTLWPVILVYLQITLRMSLFQQTFCLPKLPPPSLDTTLLDCFLSVSSDVFLQTWHLNLAGATAFVILRLCTTRLQMVQWRKLVPPALSIDRIVRVIWSLLSVLGSLNFSLEIYRYFKVRV